MVEDKCIQEELHGSGSIRESLPMEYEEQDYYEEKHKALIKRILGSEIQIDSPIVVPVLYGDLMTWALHRQIEEAGFKIIKTEGYRNRAPVYADVDSGCGSKQNLLKRGVLVLEKQGEFLIVTMDSNSDEPSTLTVTGPERIKTIVTGFADAVVEIMKKRNFYRGRKIELSYRISFIDVPVRSWDDLVLDNEIKNDIRENTIDFLANKDRLKEFGVPCKRGVLMVGAPGCGKTLACKLLLSEAPKGVTCITTVPGLMEDHRYLHWLYRIAEDLSPSIVFIEDVDLIAQERRFMRSPALLTLLSMLDGVEERDGVITVATTNDLETIDKAISKRPARFDRIIHFEKPRLKQRTDLILRLCRNIPLDVHTQSYLAKKTDNFTPAQILEVIYSLAIDYCQNNEGPKPSCITCSKQGVDNAIVKINRDNKQLGIGFSLSANRNAENYDVPIHTDNEIKSEGENKNVYI